MRTEAALVVQSPSGSWVEFKPRDPSAVAAYLVTGKTDCATRSYFEAPPKKANRGERLVTDSQGKTATMQVEEALLGDCDA